MESITAKCGLAMASFLTLCSFQACQTHPNRAIHQTEELTITLREMPAGYPSLEPYNHPYVIQPKETSDTLGLFDYEARSPLPFSRGRRHQVFTEHQRGLLGPALSKALSLALPQEVAAFIVADEKMPHRRTKGLLFVFDNELHLIIEELQKPVYQGEENTYQQQMPRWELLPNNKQRHYASRPDGKGVITNWIIIPLR